MIWRQIIADGPLKNEFARRKIVQVKEFRVEDLSGRQVKILALDFDLPFWNWHESP
jgi:hypothetical protein